MLVEIPTSRVPHEWDTIRADIEKALKPSDGQSLDDILYDLISGRTVAWRLGRGGSAHLVTWRGLVRGSIIRGLWVMYAGGRVGGGPKHRRAVMREAMDQIEAYAASQRCAEVRVEDRTTWGVILPEYDRLWKPDGGIIFRKIL